jgi:hypothetical protein
VTAASASRDSEGFLAMREKSELSERRGAGFFTRVIQGYLINEVEGEIVREIAHVLTLIDQLQAELDRAGPVIGGKLYPVVVELRQQRMLLAKLVALLPPAAEGTGPIPPPESPRTRQARRAADARWAEHRRIRGAVS